MAEPGFLDFGDFISWPFISDQGRFGSSSGTSSEMPRTGIADAGFVVGPVGDFDVLNNGVYLNQMTINSGALEFQFKCDASAFANVDWTFAFPSDAAFGDVNRVEADYSGSSDSGYGVAYLTLGRPDELRQWQNGVYEFGDDLFIENARIRDAKGGTINSLNLANDLRNCPTACCSGSAWPAVEVAIAEATNLSGEIILIEGVNCAIETNGDANAIIIAAEVGYGSMEACHDWIVTADGIVDDRLAECPVNASCDGYIMTINGLEIDGGILFLSGDAGVEITGSSEINRVIIAPDDNRVCTSSEVWGGP